MAMPSLSETLPRTATPTLRERFHRTVYALNKILNIIPMVKLEYTVTMEHTITNGI